jgi:hypothetical protein
VGLGLCGRYAQLALQVDVLEHPPEDLDTPAAETPSH